MYIGHKRLDGAIQPLSEHLRGVSELAADFARPFAAADHARRAGLLHDVGKYGARAQARQRDPEHVNRVDHATAGAQEAWRLGDPSAAFAIAGHHGGLADMGGPMASTAGDGSLWGRLRKPIDGDYRQGMAEISIPAAGPPEWILDQNSYAAGFYTRMLFSCLVDADFLDTEAFMRPQAPSRGGGDDMPALLEKLKGYLRRWDNPDKAINRWRCEILRQCLAAGEGPAGLYTLTVPTGGGKTVSSLAFALTQAVCQGKARVIYVVPYTSIIEQNARVFAQILGAENVLEHHAGADLGDDPLDAANEKIQRRRLASENWDAPVIVTTAVQFFESLYGARTSRCRKLHNIAGSVVIFDEAQLLPLKYLRPCVAAIAQLVRHYGVTGVLCTATQPSLGGLLDEFAPGLAAREICQNVKEAFAFFRRVRFQMEGEMEEQALVRQLAERSQALCVVNTRLRAQRLYDLLPREGRFHLSTLMTPRHRRAVLEEIRERLRNGAICRVVSTSLIEAGVDVDFPAVWREIAGLDAILQAAGRCNREGARPPEESVVHVFSCPGGVPPLFRQNADATAVALAKNLPVDDPACIQLYFDTLLKIKGESLDQEKILKACDKMAFATVSRAFQLIGQDTTSIYIPVAGDAVNAACLDALRRGAYTRATLRLLGASAVNVYQGHLQALMAAGKLERTEDGFSILSDLTSYSAEKGLSLHADPGAASFA